MRFHRLVTPVFIAVAASVAAFIAVVVVAAMLQDDATLASERKILDQDLNAIHQTLSAMAEDNSWWDESVKNIVLKEDIDWIDRTIGDSVVGVENLHGVLVLRPDSSLIYSNNTEQLPVPHALINEGFKGFMQLFPPINPDRASSLSGFTYVEGDLIAFGASLVQPSGYEDFDPSTFGEGSPAIVFLRKITPDRLLALGRANAIEGLRLAKPEDHHIQNMLALKYAANTIVGHVTWQTTAPGSQMIQKMILPAVVLLLIVAAAMVRFIRQANQLVEELETANQSKSAFLASTSHEIRTPLNAILGFTELISLELYGKVEGKKNKEYLAFIKESGEHLLSIINDILDISKLEAGRFDIYAEKVDPIHVVEASTKIVQSPAKEKGVEIACDCAAAVLYSDERIMRQVLINLLSNAVKFTPSGGRISIKGAQKGDRYSLVIRDTGIGMSEKELQTALSLFGQVQGEYARNHTGTGLGLPLVSRFMELLEGQFDISSTPGAGTTVRLEFPLYRGSSGQS